MKGLKIILTVFFVFSTLLFSCEEEGNCGPYFPYFKIKGLTSTNLKFTNTQSDPWVAIDESEPVNWEDYFIRVFFDVEYHALKQEGRGGGANLYALSCIESGSEGSKAGVDTLFVVTLNDYNHSYKANDTINNIIVLNDWTTFIKDYNEFYSLAQYIEENKNRVSDQNFEIKLTEEPQEITSEQKFKIIYHLNNGGTFETTTKAVQLNK